MIKNWTQPKLTRLCLFALAALMVFTPYQVTTHTSSTDSEQAYTPRLTLHVALAQDSSAVNVDTGSPAVGDESGEPSKVVRGVISIIGQFLVIIASFLVRAAGLLLEGAISKLVIDMVGSSPIDAIKGMWTVIRDICNLAFVFGFLYIGLKTVFDPQNADTKRFLSRIIIGALLINFSLFFAMVVVDLGNYTAVTVYNEGIASYVEANGAGTTIPGVFLNILGLTSIFGGGEDMQAVTTTIELNGALFGWYLMTFILVLITAFVFVMGAFLLIARFANLVYILIASPILFAATVFPQTKNYADDMWNKLVRSSIYPAVFLFLVFLSFRVIDFLKSNFGASHNLSDVASSNKSAEFTDVVLFFALAIFMMMQSISIADKLSVSGGKWASEKLTNFRKGMQRVGGGATFGLGARLGRATLGRLGNTLAEKDGLKDAASRRGFTGWAARQGLKTARVSADASFDARNVNGAGEAIGIGAGRKGGYKTVQDEVTKKEEEFAKSLGVLDDTDTQVKARKMEKEQREKELRDLRDYKSTLKDTDLPGKQMASDAIQKKEEEIAKANRQYEQEKQRRQIGTTFTDYNNSTEAAKLKQQDVDTTNYKKNVLRPQWDYYKTLTTDDERKAMLPRLQGFEKGLTKMEDDRKELLKTQPNQGYASVRENSSWWNAWPVGRLVAQEREAGKEIRKVREKGLPKEKEKTS